MSENNFKYLSDILTDEEIKQISSYVKIKLESHLEGNQLSINNMKNQLSKSVANAEKKNFAVDRELQNTKSKLNMSEDFAEKLKNQLKEAEEALQKSRHDYYETLQCKESLTYELNIVKEKMERFTNEKLDLTELLDRRLDEIKGLQIEIKNISSKLRTESEGKIDNCIKAEEIELRMLSIQHQDMRMSQERQLYQKQIASLNEELNLKVNELLTLRRERAVQLFELQSNLENKTEEHSKCMEEIKHLKQVVDKKDKHIESLATRIREMQHYSTQLEEDFQNEISAQNNLIELHKQSSLDFKKRNESLVETIEEMQKLLQAAKEAHNELEATFNVSQIKFSEQLNKVIEENNGLIRELEEMRETTANTSQENIEAEFEKQYPLAATTKKLLRNNMSFTQIFNDLVRAQQELEDQKSENAVLKEHLQQLASEAEENAPLLHRKIHEHQRALQNISELQNQMSSIITEREQWLQEKDTLFRMNKQFEREIKRYERENIDLSKQIRALIRSVQEARGFTVSHEQDSQISSSDNAIDIPQELITFRDIEELQSKNQQLMNALREVNEKLQKFEEEKSGEQIFTLQKDLDEALLQLENLRAERRQQTEMVEALVQQRDLYKLMASHSNEPNQIQRSPVAFTSSPFNSSTRINIDEHNELKSNLEKVNNEYANYREESSKRMKDLTDHNEKLREEISSSKIEFAKISSELNFTQERLQIFKTNLEQFQRENALLRERNTMLNENVKKHEQNVVLMREDVMSAQEKINRLEVTNDSLKAERDLFRNNELQLLQEKELMIRNQENQNKLINTLQSVHTNLNRMESDSINNLKTKNDKLEKENAYLKSRFEKERERHIEASALWEKHSQELQTRIDNEIEKYLKIHQELTEYQTKVQKLENELNSLKSGPNRETSDDNSSFSESDRALQSQIIVMREQYSEAQNEIKLLRSKLTNAQKACESLRTINFALEEKLNEHKLSTEEIQTKANSILTEKESLINSLKKELIDLRDKYQKAQEERQTLENEHKNISQQYLERINKLTNSLIEANYNAEKASLNEKRALEDRNNQITIANEAQANYERELQQHSNDAHMINVLRKQLESIQNKVIEAESAANKAQEQLSQSHEMWINERKNIDSNNEKIREKCSDLERINDTLNQQLELLNNRIIALQNNSSLPLLSKDEAIENTNRLLEVIKFLRKEKEILQTQISVIESEDSRLKIVIDNLKKELLHNQNELKEEKIKSKTMMSNASQHNELVKKIEMINILTESNSLLRSEKNSLLLKCQELSDKLKKIDNENISKQIEELTLKIEAKNAENIALREELKLWQNRTNNLTEQLNKTSPEDFKRLNEERNKLQLQVSTLNQESNKLNSELETQKTARRSLETQMQNIKSELDSKNGEVNKLSIEMNSIRSDNVTTQNTIVQLRKVARKYKLQFDELKVEFDKLKENESKSSVATDEDNESKNIAQESQTSELLLKIEESNNKIQEMNQQIEKLNIDFVKNNEEKEAAKQQAIEKEEKAKKIAHQAKQRLAVLNAEKMNLFRDKESVEKCIEEMREKMKSMEQNAEESALRLASIKSQYEAKMSRQEKELSEAYKQIEDFKFKLQSSQQNLQSQQQLQQTSAAIAVTAPVLSSQSSSTPVRHSVHPQQSLSAKSTPTASIRPLAVAPTHVHRTSRTSAVTQSRTATVATVQPTTEESVPHQSVPHATVQPTQTVTSQMVFIPPNSSSESEIITPHNEDDSFDESNNVSQNLRSIEQSGEVPEISGQFLNENIRSISHEIDTSVREDSAQLSSLFVPTRIEVSDSSTSQMDRNKEKVTLKRSRKSSEEAIIPFSPKKMRNESECEGIRPQTEEVLHQEITTSDKSSDSSLQQSQHSIRSGIISKEVQGNKFEKVIVGQNVDDEDEDEVIILDDDSENEQKVQSERDDDEEEEEEEEDYEEEEEENVEEGSEEVYENEDFNEEMSNGSHYEEEGNDEQSDDNNERTEEEIEIIGDSDDVQEPNQDVVNEQISAVSHQSSDRTDAVVSTTSATPLVTSTVTSSTESVPNPFIQVPTPIQRPFASGRQSFYLSHAQQSNSAYDEGDGIVPSTPTLLLPRRGDSFADALNSPRVPQARFVFSSSIPEASALSQLASEGTLGVDDTRMDLSQFDDNGRSVPTTPLANSPAVDSGVHSTVQNVDIDQDSDQTYAIDSNQITETPISADFENENCDSSLVNVETDEAEIKDNNSGVVSGVDIIDSNEIIDDEIVEQIDNETETQIEDEGKEESDIKIDDNDSDPMSSTSSVNIQRQTARRGRGFGSQRVIQRRPIVWSKESSGENPPNKESTAQNVSQVQEQPQSSHQSGRRIRLRGSSSKFSTRGDFRGGRPGRGSRGGGFHYNK